jgi:hypothetical protein
MISNDLIQAAIITTLKADTTLVNWLTAEGVGDEIREAQWQGRDFEYPAVRVQAGNQQAGGNGPCYVTTGETPFIIYCYSENDSSQQADQLAGLVDDALLGKHLSGSGFSTGPVLSDGLIKATRTGERVWQGTFLGRMQLYGGLP